MKKFWSKIHCGSPTECWPARGTPELSGYVHIMIAGKVYYAHRYAYFISTGDIPEGFVVRHSCHNRTCCNPAHLSIGTQAENNADTRRAGRHKFGSAHPMAKLTESQVVAILLAHHQDGQTAKALAASYKLDIATVQHLLCGKTWQHVYAVLQELFSWK